MTYVIQPHMTKPFCQSGDEVQPPETVSTTVINQETGIPALQSQPLGTGGIPVTRPQFNGMINFYSQQILAMQMGVQYTFFDYSSTIPDWTGYPAGVILYCASNNSYQVSLIDNNTFNFVTTPSYIDDGVHWRSIQSIQNLITKSVSSTAGNIEFNDPVDVHGDLRGFAGIVDANGSGVFFGNAAGTYYTSFFANAALASSQVYALPIDYPTGVYTGTGIISGQSWQSDESGNTGWNWPKGNTTGTPPAAGFIGYQIRSAVQSFALSAVWTEITHIDLPPGSYNLSGMGFILTSTVGLSVYVGTSNANPPSDLARGDNSTFDNGGSAITGTINPFEVNPTTSPTTRYYLMMLGDNTINVNGNITATVKA